MFIRNYLFIEKWLVINYFLAAFQLLVFLLAVMHLFSNGDV